MENSCSSINSTSGLFKEPFSLYQKPDLLQKSASFSALSTLKKSFQRTERNTVGNYENREIWKKALLKRPSLPDLNSKQASCQVNEESRFAADLEMQGKLQNQILDNIAYLHPENSEKRENLQNLQTVVPLGREVKPVLINHAHPQNLSSAVQPFGNVTTLADDPAWDPFNVNIDLLREVLSGRQDMPSLAFFALVLHTFHMAGLLGLRENGVLRAFGYVRPELIQFYCRLLQLDGDQEMRVESPRENQLGDGQRPVPLRLGVDMLPRVLDRFINEIQSALTGNNPMNGALFFGHLLEIFNYGGLLGLSKIEVYNRLGFNIHHDHELHEPCKRLYEAFKGLVARDQARNSRCQLL